MKKLLALALAFCAAAWPAGDAFSFVFLGDRTGETVAGVYEQVWSEVAKARPAVVVSIGDTIQGGDDATAEAEWKAVKRLFGQVPLYLAPGNHDVWSAKSAELYEKYSGHPLHYSFDHAQAHFTILDNSRGDNLTESEMAFLESDLAAHARQPVKFIVSHRPSWIINVAFGNPQFPLHQLAKRYGVKYVIAGHVHQLIHADVDGVTYLSLPSAGGHLRASEKYEDGWFFGYTRVEVNGTDVTFRVHDLKGRVTSLQDWGKTGLVALR